MGCFTRRSDALFELTDAVLAAGPVLSLPHLSLDPGHRRGHGSVYAALAKGAINTGALRDLLARQLDQRPAVFAIDVSCWARSDAECSPSRGCLVQVSSKNWSQNGMEKAIAGLLRALNDILHLQAKVCSSGVHKVLTGQQMSELVSVFQQRFHAGEKQRRPTQPSLNDCAAPARFSGGASSYPGR
jgi:DDE superfamily endonuclease